MPKVNCLESAKKAYSQDIENEDIANLYDALEKHKKMAENAGMDVFEELTTFSKEAGDAHEFAAKVDMYQALLKGQVIADNLQREELFRQKGHKPAQSVFRSLLSKMAGSSWKVARNHDNTWTRMQQSTNRFYESFGRDIQGDLLPLFASKQGQQELVNAMYALKKGEKVDTQFGRLAAVILKHQDEALQRLKEVGVFVNPLEDRIAPNIWDARRLSKLSMAERKQANSLYPDAGDPHYEYAFQRWQQDMLPALIEDRTFTANNVDVNNTKAVDAFMRDVFDTLTNKGKASVDSVNYASKFSKQRVLHIKPESLIAINEKYGSGSIQDSIIRELANSASMVEVMRDWTVNPINALDSTLEVMDKNPIVNQRFNKGKEYDKLKQVLKSMTNREYADANALSTIFSGLRAYESTTKLGMATLRSIPDLHNTAVVARTLGYSRLNAYANVTKNFMLGLSQADKKAYANFLQTGIASKLGAVNRYMVNPYSPSSWIGWAQHWAYKLNLLHRWDEANRGYVASVMGKYFARNRNIDWAKMTVHDKEILQQYNIGEHDWSVIRSANVQGPKGHGQFITPDSIQSVPRETIAQILEQQGVSKPSDLRIQRYKDDVERKLNTFYRDRQDHAIATPDAIDRNMLTFGVEPKQGILYPVIQNMMQFKHFAFAMWRKTVLPVLREKGATSFAEAINPLSGKMNWQGLGIMATEMMVLKYISQAAVNLALGLTPPSLRKLDTWIKMGGDILGAMDILFNVNWSDPTRSVGEIVQGPAGSEAVRIGRVAGAAYNESGKGLGYDKTAKSTYQIIKNGIPFNSFMTKWLVNHFWLNEMEDWAYPGKRQHDLQQLEEKTGATQLF